VLQIITNVNRFSDAGRAGRRGSARAITSGCPTRSRTSVTACSADTVALLKAKGHAVKERTSYEGGYQGDADTIFIDPASRLRHGAADPRKFDSRAVGLLSYQPTRIAAKLAARCAMGASSSRAPQRTAGREDGIRARHSRISTARGAARHAHQCQRNQRGGGGHGFCERAITVSMPLGIREGARRNGAHDTNFASAFAMCPAAITTPAAAPAPARSRRSIAGRPAPAPLPPARPTRAAARAPATKNPSSHPAPAGQPTAVAAACGSAR